MRYVFIWLLFTTVISDALSQIEQSEPNKAFHHLLGEISSYDRTLVTSPGLGKGQHPIAITMFHSEDYEIQLEIYNGYNKLLNDIDKTTLSAEDKISYETMQLKLKGVIDQLKYKLYLIPFNAEGGFYNNKARSIARLPFDTEADYKLYLSWLSTYEAYILGDR